MPSHLFAEGVAEPARYREQGVRAYRGNPFIEALPPLLSREDAKRQMAQYPEYHESDRTAHPIEREHMASLLMGVRHPVGLHAELHSRLSRLLRNGYLARNPLRPFFQPDIDARERALHVEGRGVDLYVGGAHAVTAASVQPSATGLTFLGVSGIGKSAAVEMCLHLYPQLLVHEAYEGRQFTRTQIVWLRLDAPPDGSILSLAERFFTAIDSLHAALGLQTDYRAEYMPARATVQRVIPRMARLAAQHGLGVLVLDEIQDLNPRGARAILSFLVQLVNTVGIPVVLVGGIDALPVLSAQFRQARRGASEGDLIVERAERGADWRAFCEVLWRYQYTREVTELTDEHVEALYDVSQGITQYLVLAYKLAQIRAMSVGLERVTPAVIRSIRDSLAQAGPVLSALRRRNTEVLRRFGDVVVPDGICGIPFVRGDPPRVGAPGGPGAARAADPAGATGAGEQPAAPDVRPMSPDRVSDPAMLGESRVAEMGRVPEAEGPADVADVAGGDRRSLADVVRAARANGESTYDALARHGVIGDAVWLRVSGQSTSLPA